MTKLFKKAHSIVKNKAHNAAMLRNSNRSVAELLKDNRGDMAVDFLGKIIIAVVIVGLLIFAVNAIFPNLFTNILSQVESKLTAAW